MIHYWDNLQDIQKIQKILNQDQIILAASDTVLGLFGSLTQKSYDKLNEMKQRRDKPYLIMIQSIEMLPKFIDQPISIKVKEIISLSWPGPITLIFKARQDLPNFMKNGDGTIALRVPYHTGLLKLLSCTDGLFSTSANVHTHPIPVKLEEVNDQIKSQVGGICLDRVDKLDLSIKPSTILDCSSDNIKVVRMGSQLHVRVQELIS